MSSKIFKKTPEGCICDKLEYLVCPICMSINMGYGNPSKSSTFIIKKIED